MLPHMRCMLCMHAILPGVCNYEAKTFHHPQKIHSHQYYSLLLPPVPGIHHDFPWTIVSFLFYCRTSCTASATFCATIGIQQVSPAQVHYIFCTKFLRGPSSAGAFRLHGIQNFILDRRHVCIFPVASALNNRYLEKQKEYEDVLSKAGNSGRRGCQRYVTTRLYVRFQQVLH